MAKGVNPVKDWCEMSKIVAHAEIDLLKIAKLVKAMLQEEISEQVKMKVEDDKDPRKKNRKI